VWSRVTQAKESADLEAMVTGYCVEPINLVEILADPTILFMEMAW